MPAGGPSATARQAAVSSPSAVLVPVALVTVAVANRSATPISSTMSRGRRTRPVGRGSAAQLGASGLALVGKRSFNGPIWRGCGGWRRARDPRTVAPGGRSGEAGMLADRRGLGGRRPGGSTRAPRATAQQGRRSHRLVTCQCAMKQL